MDRGVVSSAASFLSSGHSLYRFVEESAPYHCETSLAHDHNIGLAKEFVGFKLVLVGLQKLSAP